MENRETGGPTVQFRRRVGLERGLMHGSVMKVGMVFVRPAHFVRWLNLMLLALGYLEWWLTWSRGRRRAENGLGAGE